MSCENVIPRRRRPCRSIPPREGCSCSFPKHDLGAHSYSYGLTEMLAGDLWPARLLLQLAVVPDAELIHSVLIPLDFGSTDYAPGLLSAPAPDEPPP